MRTFQFSDAKSHKFWNIDVQGTSFTVTYGKIGTTGQTQTKTFASDAAAQAEADKLVKEKTKKGYVETTPKATVSDAEAFETALRAHPHDLAGWSAFADFLAERDDPRGEFMQTQIALEDESRPKKERDTLKKKEAALLKTHAATWLGALAPFLLNQKAPKRAWRPETIKFAFRRGWLADLEVPNLGVEFVRALNGAPEAKFLQRLHVHTNAYEYEEGAPNIPEYADGTYKPGPDLPKGVSHYELAMHLLARCPHFESVCTLHLGNPLADGFDESDQCHTEGELAHHYVKQMPHIEELRLLAHNVDSNKLFVLPMPHLRVLQVFHASKYPVDKLAANPSLGNLTHLLLQPHAPDESKPYIRLRELRAICRATNVPKLTHLALRYTDFGDEGVREIIDSGILKRLKLLDLRGGCVTDDGARLLAAAPDAKNLERLNLDTNALSSIGIKELKSAGIKASTEAQHNEVPPFDEDQMPEYMFEADIE
ncbi:WGR domain-containing protein [Frigoriglobus tundricola]|uniref:WGR domain-containing protein n=1 Tax=Frigoriglobus tundricola TaxID=2774151 RepID=A0A6M5YR60_9BACT|nr:WGR domain-containing protein [Frigoriglobus tundricola]QJW96557.1 hypothetical protein FTUN_4114 [Frigoriglobus tundricola]